MAKRKRPPVVVAVPPAEHEVLTPEEQRDRMDEMVLARCAEILVERRERRKAKAELSKQKGRRRLFLRRCKACPAMKVYLRPPRKPRGSDPAAGK